LQWNRQKWIRRRCPEDIAAEGVGLVAPAAEDAQQVARRLRRTGEPGIKERVDGQTIGTFGGGCGAVRSRFLDWKRFNLAVLHGTPAWQWRFGSAKGKILEVIP